MEKNREAIDSEVKRLTGAGYQGDAEDKMYKAARYYFRSRTRNRKTRVTASPDGETKTTTRRYITVPKTLLASMDQHIATVKEELPAVETDADTLVEKTKALPKEEKTEETIEQVD